MSAAMIRGLVRGLLERLPVHFHWQNLNAELRPRLARGWRLPFSGRAWFRPATEGRNRPTLRLYWNLLSSSCRAQYSWSAMESEHVLSLALPPVWLGMSVGVPYRSRWALKRFNYEASWGVRIHSWAIWWSFAENDHEWRSTDPWWKRGNWHPGDTFLGNHVSGEKVLAKQPVVVPMPEGAYPATATLSERTRGRKRNPFKTTWRSVTIEMDEGYAIPHSGKGENSYDCGEDATFSMSTAADSIEQGIGKMVASQLETRRRRGDPAKWPLSPDELAARRAAERAERARTPSSDEAAAEAGSGS